MVAVMTATKMSAWRMNGEECDVTESVTDRRRMWCHWVGYRQKEKNVMSLNRLQAGEECDVTESDVTESLIDRRRRMWCHWVGYRQKEKNVMSLSRLQTEREECDVTELLTDRRRRMCCHWVGSHTEGEGCDVTESVIEIFSSWLSLNLQSYCTEVRKGCRS